jgi:hypothetical protein
MRSPIDQLLEKVAEIEVLVKAPGNGELDEISKVASTVATSARLWIENPSKATLYEKPLNKAIAKLRRALTEASSTE